MQINMPGYVVQQGKGGEWSQHDGRKITLAQPPGISASTSLQALKSCNNLALACPSSSDIR
jgi:hypothetical protein